MNSMAVLRLPTSFCIFAIYGWSLSTGLSGNLEAISTQPRVYTCMCSKGTVYDGRRCVNGSTAMPIFDPSKEDTFYGDFSEYGSVVVQSLDCHLPHYYEVNVTEDDFFVLVSGSLFISSLSHETTHYCIQHYKNNTQTLYAKVCLHLPTTPLCCPQHQAMDSYGQCVQPSHNAPELPFQVLSIPSNVHRIDSCPPDYNKNLQRMDGIYTNDTKTTVLRIWNFHQALPTTYNTSYCLGVEEVDGYLTVILKHCSPKVTYRICCPEEAIIDKEGDCVQYGNGRGLWKEHQSYYEKRLECSEGSSVRKTQLLSTAVGSEPPSLRDVLQIYQLKNYDNYCLGVSTKHGALNYEVHLCETYPIVEYEHNCNSSSNITCLQKCCPEGHFWDRHATQCFKSSLKVYVLDFIKTEAEQENFGITSGHPSCDNLFFYNITDELRAVVDRDGFLHLGKASPIQHPSMYCVDFFADDNRELKPFILSCYQDDIMSHCPWKFTLTSVMMGVSCVFFSITLLVYCSVKELRGRMVGKCIICEILSLLMSYVTLIVLQSKSDFQGDGCVAAGFIELVSVLASFFWLNVLCYDMWSNLRHVRLTDGCQEGKMKLFLLYSAYAWGAPLIVGTSGLIIDRLPIHYDVVRLNFGVNKCFFTPHDKLSAFVYMYGIILILLLVNLGFFGHVIAVLLKRKREQVRLARSPDSAVWGSNLASNIERQVTPLNISSDVDVWQKKCI